MSPTEPARPLRETVAKLVGDGITRHVNGVTSMRHNKTAIATVARQVSEEIEAVVLAETEQLDLDIEAARNEAAGLRRVVADQDARLIAQAKRIEELEHAFERLAGVPLADASPQLRNWLANTKEPVGPGRVDTPAALQQRIDAAVPGAITALEAKVSNLSHALDVVQLREIRLNEDRARDGRLIDRYREETEKLRARVESITAERDHAEEQVHKIRMLKFWTNEDRKDFFFAADVWDITDPGRHGRPVESEPTATPAESCPDGANCCGGGACRE